MFKCLEKEWKQQIIARLQGIKTVMLVQATMDEPNALIYILLQS